jgi:putative hydrolase of the HAD superfamily
MGGLSALRVRAVLLDMDDTLLIDRATTRAALWATAADACASHALDPAALGDAVLAEARRLWGAGPHAGYCRRIGISSWEGLWGTFAVGDDPDTVGLRIFAPPYRRAAWGAALERFGVRDGDLAAELAERFVAERAGRQRLFPEVLPALAALRGAGLRLGILTNGDRDLQRRKAAQSGLAALADHVVISGAVGIGKPEPEVFRHALALCGARPDEAVMVGDSRERDVAGGAAAGLHTVWLNRFAEAPDDQAGRPTAELPDLRGLPALLGEEPSAWAAMSSR